MGIFQNGYELHKINDDTTRIVIKFRMPGEDFDRIIDFTFLKY